LARSTTQPKAAPLEAPEKATDDATEPNPEAADTSADAAAPRNVVEAIIAVMREVRAVGKDGRNTQQNYNFRGIDATVNALGPAMRKHGLIVSPQVKEFEYGTIEVGSNRTRQGHVQVRVVYTFHHSNPTTGELTTLAVEVPGESMDSGDKCTAKAMSVAFRIALLQTFALPTDEPDPDESSYERSSGLPPLTADVVKQAAGWAAQQEDLDAAFSSLHERFSTAYAGELSTVQVTNKAGETMNGDEYVEYARSAAKEARAAAERARQDADAEATDAPAQSAQSARTEQQPDEEARAQEPAHVEPPARATRETKQQKLLRQAREEAEFQARTLGVDFTTFVEPMCSTAGDVGTFSATKATKQLVGNRELVIEALREQGRATEAEAYARIGQGFPMVMEHVFGDVDAADRATQGEPAPVEL
jgi:hypothetical protein